MIFNKHLELEGRHALLSPSKYQWVNYNDEQMYDKLEKAMDAALGTRLHNLAAELIRMGIMLPNTHQTLNLYVNDAIRYRMWVEQPVKVSDNAFGTADSIWFGPDHEDEGKMILRIFDLKNGVSPTSQQQLEVYAAYFCIEYDVPPLAINYDLRIYQNDDIEYFETDPEDILFVMDQTRHFDKLIEQRKGGVTW